jgi:hypothetical protein
MTKRTGVAAALLLACASLLHAQQDMFKLEGASGTIMVSLNEPKLVGGKYVFNAWPDGGLTKLPQSKVKKITRLTGGPRPTIYEINLIPSGTLTAKDAPALKNGLYTFHDYRSGTLLSVRQSEVHSITPMDGNRAFWVEQGLRGGSKSANLALEGTDNLVVIGTPSRGGGSSQAGRQNLNSVGGQNGTTGINGAPVGNWQYQGTPGASDAYAPANATVDGGGVPTMPAATNGTAPPTQPQ